MYAIYVMYFMPQALPEILFFFFTCVHGAFRYFILLSIPIQLYR